MEAVMNLPHKYKEVVLLYYYLGLNLMEISEALGVAASTISTRLKNRAKGFAMIWKEGMSMCDRAPENNAIRRAMDACLPRLENEADFERMVLKQVRGEIQVKKSYLLVLFW